ncbi:hypothetical protein EIK77_007936 [Talaromyces pinophilus]|nr:hypothetical protein EIK77_007936 [Talaromyces pinophilus]
MYKSPSSPTLVGISKAHIITCLEQFRMASLHSTVAAVLTAASIATAATNEIGKRGLAYNNNNVYGNATYANDFFANSSQVTWGYDWGYPSWNLSSVFEL